MFCSACAWLPTWGRPALPPTGLEPPQRSHYRLLLCTLYPAPCHHCDFYTTYIISLFCSKSFLGISLLFSLYLNSSASFTVTLNLVYFLPSLSVVLKSLCYSRCSLCKLVSHYSHFFSYMTKLYSLRGIFLSGLYRSLAHRKPTFTNIHIYFSKTVYGELCIFWKGQK